MKVLREGQEKTFPITVTELTEDKLNKEAAEQPNEENRIGLAVEDLDARMARRFDLKDTKGVVVTDVAPGSTAADAGLRRGDVILEVNGKAIPDAKTFQKVLVEQPKKSYSRFLVKREGRTIIVAVEMP